MVCNWPVPTQFQHTSIHDLQKGDPWVMIRARRRPMTLGSRDARDASASRPECVYRDL
jgi:hypothetical protein